MVSVLIKAEAQRPNPPAGIDLGSNKAVMAVVKKGGIDIVLNDASNRQTP